MCGIIIDMQPEQLAKEARKTVLGLIYKAQTSHIGSNFSCIDIMAVLFGRFFNWEKDRFILSAGWKAASLYFFLWKAGRITEKELNSYCQGGSKWIGLSEPIHPDIPFAGGSMGMGLPAAVGFALAKKLKKEEGRVYCLMSDGELQCGTTWEAALMALHYGLDNLTVVVDYNGFQAMGLTKEILGIPLKSLQEFFVLYHIDGHDLVRAERSFNLIRALGQGGVPRMLIAHTIKGKGVSFMENNNLYHYKAPSKEEYELALKELNG